MTPWVCQLLTTEDFTLYAKALTIVSLIPDSAHGPRCHEVARIVHLFMPDTTKVFDGYFDLTEHSWLVILKSRMILDVYRVGQYPQVALVDARYIGANNSYKPGPLPRVRIRHKMIERTYNRIQKI